MAETRQHVIPVSSNFPGSVYLKKDASDAAGAVKVCRDARTVDWGGHGPQESKGF